MYFIPNNSRIYRYIAYSNKNVRYVITSTIIVAIGLILTSSLYYITSTYQTIFTQEIALLEKQKENALATQAKNRLLEDSTQSIRTNIQSYKNSSSLHEYVKNQQLRIMQSLQKSQLQIISYHFDKERPEKDYSVHTSKIVFQGTINNISLFLKSLKQPPSIINIDQWLIQKISSSIFRMSCTITFIYYPVNKIPSTIKAEGLGG